MTDKTEVSNVIRRLVTNAGEIMGSRLAMELKVAVPDWRAADYGVRGLREFLVTHVPEVEAAGRSGMDFVYRLKPALNQKDSTVAPSSLAGDLWRTWVSPGSPFALAFNAADGSAIILRRTDEVPDGHVLVEPATIQEHRAIARHFVSKLHESTSKTLADIADSPGQNWWREWLIEVEKIGQLSTWNAFRHDQLRALLKSRLEKAGVVLPLLETATGAVAQGRHSRPREESIRDPRSLGGVRAIVVSVIGRMRDEELRDLKLPLGLVLDVLNEKKP